MLAQPESDLLPHGIYIGHERVVIHDRKYRPIVSCPHSDSGGTWSVFFDGNETPWAVSFANDAKPMLPDARVDHHDHGFFHPFDKWGDEQTQAQVRKLIDTIPVLAAEIERRDAAERADAICSMDEENNYRTLKALSDEQANAFTLVEEAITTALEANDESETTWNRIQEIERASAARRIEFETFWRNSIRAKSVPIAPSQEIVSLQNRGIVPALPPTQQISVEDFVAYMPNHQFIFKPTREMWPASSVDARLGTVQVVGREKPIKASAWLNMHRPVEQATWAPGEPIEIKDKLVSDGGWIDRSGCRVFNLYRPPVIQPIVGDVSPWLGLIHWVFPDEADHIIRWLAHRVQRPWEKINHAIVFGGQQGIGKDSILEPVKHAIGPWNMVEISPQQMLGRFNGFVKSVILRVSEARDLGDVDRFSFYEHAKTLMAAPPDVLRVDEKNLREHAVFNCTGVIITTNNRDALHLPADDRRHFVAWSPRSKEEVQHDYWSSLWRWFASGGNRIVAHHLASLDLDSFDPKAPPPKTAAFWSIVDASRAPEDAEMQDAIDTLKNPPAVTLSAVQAVAPFGFKEWLSDRKNRRKIPFRMDQAGYIPVRNGDAADGLWVIGGKRQTIYAKKALALRDQIAAARALTSQ